MLGCMKDMKAFQPVYCPGPCFLKLRQSAVAGWWLLSAGAKLPAEERGPAHTVNSHLKIHLNSYMVRTTRSQPNLLLSSFIYGIPVVWQVPAHHQAAFVAAGGSAVGAAGWGTEFHWEHGQPVVADLRDHLMEETWVKCAFTIWSDKILSFHLGWWGAVGMGWPLQAKRGLLQ